MKKVIGIVAIVLTLLVVPAFAGCSSGSASGSSSESGSTSASASATAASSSASASDSAATSSASSSAQANPIANGQYEVDFNTDNSMFRVNDANKGKGVLTVDDKGMTVHISLVSKKITNLYVGTADKAKDDSANVLQPTTDTVTYDDGDTEEVYGFDVPVPEIDEEFDLAILGEKGKWYDHKVSVSNPTALENSK